MEEGNVTVLVDAKEEYTKQLISILKPCIYQGIKSIYMDAKDICNQDNAPDNVLMVFQDLLSRIPKWSQDIINKEFERITNISKCDYIDDLLKVVYVSHIKILTIVHSAQKNKKISLKVPSGSHFIHLCYIECAREFWKDPYYFSDRVTKYENQKNMRDSESMISECIMETIRKQLPVRHILKEFLNEPDEDIEEEEDDIKEPAKKKYLKKLESVVKKELKSTSANGDISDINIELIRKVIREEMASRPTTDTIKKELVDTVVEKIVEKTQEEFTDSVEVIETVKAEPVKAEDALEVGKETGKETGKENGKDTGKETGKETGKDTGKTEDVNVEIVKVEEIVKAENVLEVDTKKKDKKNNSLETLLNDTEGDGNTENDIEIDDEIDVNIDLDSLITNTIVDKPKSNDIKLDEKQSQLVINNIDEINLNLDELDDDLDNDLDNELNKLNNGIVNDSDNEIDLDEMQSVDLSKTVSKNSKSEGKSDGKSDGKTDNKSDPNTKYIFFKDVE